jgi:hypothetical protein
MAAYSFSPVLLETSVENLPSLERAMRPSSASYSRLVTVPRGGETTQVIVADYWKESVIIT